MKNVTLFLIVFKLGILNIETKAQEFDRYYYAVQNKFSNYYCPIDEKDYGIYLDFSNNFTVYIDAFFQNGEVSEAGFMLYDSIYSNFLNKLNAVKIKYEEWAKIARANKVRDFMKEIESDSCSTTCYFNRYGSTRTIYNVKLHYVFSVKDFSDRVEYDLFIITDELVDPDYENLKCNGVMICFRNTLEIENFIANISENKIEAYKTKLFKEKANQERIDSLFK